MTREGIQAQALQKLIENNYTGVLALDVGVGKSKIAIDAIKKGNFERILITSPRDNLKRSWKEELWKWLKKDIMEDDAFPDRAVITKNSRINIENIQTCYKWNKEIIQSFKIIIYDEVHTCGEEYFNLIKNAKELNIPIIGLTGTPNEKDEFKKEVLYKELPIVYKYLTASEDKITNKINYYLYRYDLTDDYKVITGTKDKKWLNGEKSQYDYIQKVFDESKEIIVDFYFKEIKERVKTLKELKIKESYKRFYDKITSKDLEYFRKIYWQSMKAKKMPYELYANMKYLMKDDYAKFGLKAELYASISSEQVKSTFYKYIWARNARKDFLSNLSSSADIAIKIKEQLLKNKDNKILLFSELTQQAERLSPYSIHSKTGDTAKKTLEQNTLILDKFNKGGIRELSSCLSLTLGLNLTNTNWAIFESFSGSDTNAKQRSGRLNRLHIDNVANAIIILPNNTQSEIWFENAFGHINEIKELKSINDLI